MTVGVDLERLPANCPLCGSRRIRSHYIRDGQSLGCQDCGCNVCAYNPNAGDKCLERWNTRTALLAQAERVAVLEGALRPFAEAWSVATHHKDVVSKLTMAQLGELAAHEVSGVHFRNARSVLPTTEAEGGPHG